MQPRLRGSSTVTIGDTVYTIRQMGARQGREIWFILVAALSGGLKEVRQDISSINDAGLNDLGKVIEGALKALGKDDFNTVCDAMVEHTAVVSGNRHFELSMMFDDHFAGRDLEMGKWLMEALKANFADFFTEFKAMVAPKSPDAQ